MPSDAEIEKEIQDKGLTAPRVTLAHIENKIVGEYATTLDRAFSDTTMSVPLIDGMSRFTIVVLCLQNGFIVTGESAPASASNFDEALGRKIARQHAIDKIWMLEGYALRERLYGAPNTPQAA